MPKTKPTAADCFAAMAPAQREIPELLRGVIRKAAPTLEETVKWGYPAYVGHKIVCSIMAFKDHVNLAFFRGAELADPHDLLEGDGKGMRHVRFHSPKDVRKQAIAVLVKEAAALDARDKS
jgi:hypothetical protein